MLGLLDLLVVVLELAWVLSGLIRAMPSPLESSACTKFLQTHNQNSKPIPTPSAWPLIHSFITRDILLLLLLLLLLSLCTTPVQPASTRDRWSPFVPQLQYLPPQQLQYTVQPGLSCQRLTATSPNSGTLPRPVFRRTTPADPGKVCQAGASEQTLIPISLIFQHWPSRPKPDPKVRVECHSRFESAADHAVALPIGSLGLINTTTSAARGARQQRQSY